VKNSLESAISPALKSKANLSPEWLKVGLIAAASAMVGGVAAAWWYRTTLKKLHQAEEISIDPQYAISEGDSPEEL
jgi:hypothetical protein